MIFILNSKRNLRLGIKQTILLKLIKSYFPEKQEDHDGPMSLTRANINAYLILAFHTSRLLKTFVSDMMVLQNGVAVPYMASSAPFFLSAFKINFKAEPPPALDHSIQVWSKYKQ